MYPEKFRFAPLADRGDLQQATSVQVPTEGGFEKDAEMAAGPEA